MDDPRKILITGASGLLGKSLVEKFAVSGWQVIAHYFSKKGGSQATVDWIRGDLSTLERTRDFIKKNFKILKECSVLINNYGPLTYKDTEIIRSEDLISDFYSNLISANEITSVLLGTGRLQSVVNIGFEGAGEIKPYKNILPYAIAKSGLQMLTLSYERAFSGTRFFFYSPPSIAGGEYRKNSDVVVKPKKIAEDIYIMIDERVNV